MQQQSRRRFIRNGLLLLPALSCLPASELFASSTVERRLSFYHTHTKQELSLVYARNGRYISRALDQLNDFLGDFRSNQTHPIDPQLFNYLNDLQQQTDHPDAVFEVISGYRSPASNSALRQHSKGVAKQSLHMQGMAIDVRLAGMRTRTLRDLAIDMKRGGTGFYSSSDFLHLDTGPVRHW